MKANVVRNIRRTKDKIGGVASSSNDNEMERILEQNGYSKDVSRTWYPFSPPDGIPMVLPFVNDCTAREVNRIVRRSSLPIRLVFKPPPDLKDLLTSSRQYEEKCGKGLEGILTRTTSFTVLTSCGSFSEGLMPFPYNDYLACEPVEAIQHYSHRVSGRGSKKEELKDVPENIVEILIDCLLDGLSLGQPELHMAAEELMENPTEFFLKLGSNNEERKKALEYRKDCRIRWIPNCSVAINRALGDVRRVYARKNDSWQ
ncbi:hypothetical protein Y032_0130g1556 [Ancylostoma ceylanicum]|uniref:Uncharacterized protein n=1 Tax=Ancylostoma ceylanicum TaxID=53326 RepID=A0A016T7A1_9BILA|nr:hypothetical protein Y032_0130g1556 [Ancylostoma ceylanicum]